MIRISRMRLKHHPNANTRAEIDSLNDKNLKNEIETRFYVSDTQYIVGILSMIRISRMRLKRSSMATAGDSDAALNDKNLKNEIETLNGGRNQTGYSTSQ